jgi:hypothetical protein
MKENERKLNEVKNSRQSGALEAASTLCAKCRLPLDGETVELPNKKEYHKK